MFLHIFKFRRNIKTIWCICLLFGGMLKECRKIGSVFGKMEKLMWLIKAVF